MIGALAFTITGPPVDKCGPTVTSILALILTVLSHLGLWLITNNSFEDQHFVIYTLFLMGGTCTITSSLKLNVSFPSVFCIIEINEIHLQTNMYFGDLYFWNRTLEFLKNKSLPAWLIWSTVCIQWKKQTIQYRLFSSNAFADNFIFFFGFNNTNSLN